MGSEYPKNVAPSQAQEEATAYWTNKSDDNEAPVGASTIRDALSLDLWRLD